MNLIRLIPLLFFFVCAVETTAQLAGQECFPEKKNQLVYDEANILDVSNSRLLNDDLVSFNDSTGNQIAVVIVPDLCGMEKAQFAIELGELWGVGQQKEDNGIIILVKPKTSESKGEVFIAIGRGLEAVIPDATTLQIVDQEMIPMFRQNDYYGGISNAVIVLKSLARGEYNSSEYGSSGMGKSKAGILVFVMIGAIILMVLLFRTAQVRRYARVNNLDFWVAWALLNNATRTHSGSWHDFNRGRGHFGGWSGGGGGGGGFGGFGGGSFGGGGSGGSW